MNLVTVQPLHGFAKCVNSFFTRKLSNSAKTLQVVIPLIIEVYIVANANGTELVRVHHFVVRLWTRGALVLYHLPECIRYAEQAWKYMTICCINFHLCRSIRKQIWPCHKNGQGQPSVIVWTNLVVPEYLMLYTKFQCHGPFGSREEGFYYIY